MSLSHQRKKQPEAIRRKLLDSAILIAAEGKPGDLTIQSVAAAAGVTKGGLTHHFPTKESLADAVFADLMRSIDEEIDRLMAGDRIPYGRFTRAYVRAVFRRDVPEKTNPWTAVSITLLMDDRLCALWSEWLARRLEQHKDTDNDPLLEIVRYAADGVWLENVTLNKAVGFVSREDLFARLIAMTSEEGKR